MNGPAPILLNSFAVPETGAAATSCSCTSKVALSSAISRSGSPPGKEKTTPCVANSARSSTAGKFSSTVGMISSGGSRKPGLPLVGRSSIVYEKTP